MAIRYLFILSLISFILHTSNGLKASKIVKTKSVKHNKPKQNAFIQASFLMSVSLIIIHPNQVNAAVVNGVNDNLTTRQVIIRSTEKFLTNPVLDSMRKIDQIDNDTDSQNTDRVILLVPIVEINKEVETIVKLIDTKQIDNLKQANTIINDQKYNTPVFKKVTKHFLFLFLLVYNYNMCLYMYIYLYLLCIHIHLYTYTTHTLHADL